MHDFMKLYTGPPKFEFGRVEFASGGPPGPPVSKVNVEPCILPKSTGDDDVIYTIVVKISSHHGGGRLAR